jgi:GT2 family glycosyltransferase
MSPVVSVIYVNYNTSGLLLQSICSLMLECRQIPMEIIIIDNNSRKDEKLKLQQGLDELNHENIQVIFSDINAGFSRANNRAAKKATGKYLFFLNPDTYPDPERCYSPLS